MASKHPWDAVLRQRLSRRRLLAAGVTVGAASAAVACGGRESKDKSLSGAGKRGA